MGSTIPNAPNGENTSPASTVKIPGDDGKFIQLANLVKNLGSQVLTALNTALNIVIGTDTITGLDSITFDPQAVAPSHAEGLMWYCNDLKTLSFYDNEAESSLQIGHEMWFRGINNTGVTITNGQVVYISGESGGFPEISLAKADDEATSLGAIGLATHDIENGTTGRVTVVGTVRDVDTSSFSAGDVLLLSASSAGSLTATHVVSPNYDVHIGMCTYSHATEGTIEVQLSIGGNTQSSINIFNGSILEDHTVTCTSNGTTCTLNLTENGANGFLSLYYSGAYTKFTVPASVTLTPGSDTSPTLNYVYILQSTGSLTVSTTSWPAAQHTPVATVLVQSAASAQTDGFYKVHAWTDHVYKSSDLMGHVSHVNYWIRQQHASWDSGVALTPTVGSNVFDVATSAGVVLQLHTHSFPAFDTGVSGEIYIVNDSVTAYNRLGNLTTVVTDSEGVTMSGKYYNLVIWGVVSEDDADCQLMCNLPNASYNLEANAINDVDRTANYSIPSDFKGCGFLIARLTVKNSGGSGGTFTISQNEDLRGSKPSTGAGGGATGSQVEFSDNTFRVQDDGDVTKEIAFQASGITTGNTRTITMPDANVDLGAIIAAGLLADVSLTDGQYSGITATLVAGATLAFGDLCYLASADGRMELVDADAEASSKPMLAVCLEALTDGNSGLFLLYGIVREDDWNWTTKGAPLFISTTAGDMTETAPSAAGDFVRRVGSVYDADTVMFNPSGEWIELA